MQFKNLSLLFTWLLLLIILAPIPIYNLETLLSGDYFLSLHGIIIFPIIILLIFLMIRSLCKAEKNEYKELVVYLRDNLKGKFQPKKLRESKAVLRLAFSGGVCLWLIFIFKDSPFTIPLFVLGTTLIIWGLSLFLEDNGVYKFSELRLSNKWLLSGIVSAIIFWAGFKSAGQINSVFNIDPSFFPFTFTAMVLFNIATLFCLFMIPVFILSLLITCFHFIREVANKRKNDESLIFPIVLVFSVYASYFGLSMLSPEMQYQMANLIALKTDFNSTHTCKAEWLKEKPVIFVGPNSNYVLALSEENKGKYSIQECLSL